MSDDRVYFVHLGGTGGNTLAATLAASQPGYKIVHLTRGAGHAPGDASILSEPGRVLFYGHHLLGLPETVGLDVRYVTLLRHPWDRVMTDWFWMHREEPRSGTIPDFGRFVDEAGHLEFYIHQFAEANPHLNPNFVYKDYAHFSNEAAYEKACRVLEEKFSFVGIMEMFEETCLLLSMKLRMQSLEPWWARRHPRTPGRASFFDLPKRTRDAIVEKTQFDTRLYEDQRARFEQAVETSSFGNLIAQYKDGVPKG